MNDADPLGELEEYFSRILDGLKPSSRRRAMMKLGQAVRRANLARQQANIEPDGSAMEPRKRRLDRSGRVRRRGRRKMFRKLRYARHLRIDARTDSVELKYLNRLVERVAAEHHFGLEGRVGKDFEGKPIRYKYPARELLGFAEEDREEILQIAEELLGLDG